MFLRTWLRSYNRCWKRLMRTAELVDEKGTPLFAMKGSL
jgi:hypothetical protein